MKKKNVLGTALFVLAAAFLYWKHHNNESHHENQKLPQPAPTIVASPVAPTPPKQDLPVEKSVFTDIQSIIGSGVLKVAMLQDDRSPFFFTNKEGNLVGVDVELAEVVAKSLGVRVEFIRTAKDFNAVVDQVSQGQAHVGISKLSFTDSRAKKIIYTNPYITLRAAFLINRSQLESLPAGISLNEIFKNYRMKVAVQVGSSQIASIKKLFPEAELVEAPTLDAVNQLVLSGQCFARFSDDSELTKLLLQKPEYNIRCAIVAINGENDKIHIAVNPKFPSLRDYINTLINNKREFRLEIEQVFRKFEKQL